MDYPGEKDNCCIYIYVRRLIWIWNECAALSAFLYRWRAWLDWMWRRHQPRIIALLPAMRPSTFRGENPLCADNSNSKYIYLLCTAKYSIYKDILLALLRPLAELICIRENKKCVEVPVFSFILDFWKLYGMFRLQVFPFPYPSILWENCKEIIHSFRSFFWITLFIVEYKLFKYTLYIYICGVQRIFLAAKGVQVKCFKKTIHFRIL